MVCNLLFSLCLVGSLLATFFIFIRTFFDEGCKEFGGARAFETTYIGLLFIFILMSITKPIEKSSFAYTSIVLIFGIFIFVSIGFGINYFWKETENLIVAYAIIVMLVGSYLLPIVLNFTNIN